MTDRITEAFEKLHVPCPRCHAASFNPCRTPRFRTAAPHRDRLLAQAAADQLSHIGSGT